MPASPYESCRRKVEAIFRELAGDRATNLSDSRLPQREPIVDALIHQGETAPDTAKQIAFHLSDWNSDAAFLVALHLFPERFTLAEIAAGIDAFLIHAPNHIAAAAVLSGNPIDDIFEVGALRGPSEDSDADDLSK